MSKKKINKTKKRKKKFTKAVLSLSVFVFCFFFKDFIYLFDRDTAREGTQSGGVGEREAGFPLSGEPDVGLDPSTLGS